MTEEATFDWVELGTIGWIMRHTDGDSQLVDQSLKVFLEQMLSATVTTAAIT